MLFVVGEIDGMGKEGIGYELGVVYCVCLVFDYMGIVYIV